jgi:hypothetical protein
MKPCGQIEVYRDEILRADGICRDETLRADESTVQYVEMKPCGRWKYIEMAPTGRVWFASGELDASSTQLFNQSDSC